VKYKGFNAIVINAKWAKIIIKVLSLIGIAMMVKALIYTVPKDKYQLAVSEEFYTSIISSETHHEKREISFSDMIEKITGFDFKDAKSIIGREIPMFSEEFEPEQPVPVEPETQTPEPISTPAPEPVEQKPLEEENRAGGMKISNLTEIEVEPDALADSDLSFKLENLQTPQILIMHTHTTESYTESDTNTYNVNSSDRNLDENKNISAVGKAMAEVFNNAGISTIQDATVHDYPSYNGAYTRALATIKKNLGEHTGIKVVLDVHRDGITREDGTKVKVAGEINGEKVAQCMFVIGSNALLTHDNWQENLKLACKIQKKANEMYPGLMRPIILREERFNQQISKGCVIIEVGSNGNTLEEAVLGGKYIAEVIVKVLKNW